MDYQSIMKELLNPSHSPNRSGKDLSCRKVFTAKAGELLPILCEHLVPNDYVKLDTASLIRTFPLQTAAFLRARVHFDFFFVPYTSVWRNWNRFYYQRNDRESSLMNGFAYEPNIKIRDIYNASTFGAGSKLDSAQARGKLAQLLGYGNLGMTNVYYNATAGSPQDVVGQKSLSILPMIGYQRIYNFWYRNAWRDEPSYNDQFMYSCDNWDCSSYTNSLFNSQYPMTLGGSESPLKMRYHSWFSDLFMGSLPNQQFGSVSSINIAGSGSTGSDKDRHNGYSDSAFAGFTPQDVLTITSTTNGSVGFNSTSNYPYRDEHTHVLSGNIGIFDVMTLRRALALQKWKEYNMRAGWKNRNQARAMFGVSTPEDRKHEIEFIKGYDFPVMIDEVINQSNTNLGEIAGKGIGVGNGELLEFNPGERHGMLYCIAYVLPQAEYDAIGIEKSLIRSEPFDHYVPAFENLGLEPIYKYEINAEGDPTQFDAVIGYAPRYHEYKTRIDKVYGEFMAGKSLDSWVSVRRDLANMANLGYIPTSLFYVDPSCLDTVFASAVDGLQTSDQFILNVNFRDKMVRPMSDLGLPNL